MNVSRHGVSVISGSWYEYRSICYSIYIACTMYYVAAMALTRVESVGIEVKEVRTRRRGLARRINKGVGGCNQ